MVHVMSFKKLTPRYFLPAPSHRCGMGAVCCFLLVGTRISRVGWVKMQRPVWFTAQEVFYPSYKCMPKIILGRVLWAMGVRGEKKCSSSSTESCVVFDQTGNSGSRWAYPYSVTCQYEQPLMWDIVKGFCQQRCTDVGESFMLMTRSWIIVISWASFWPHTSTCSHNSKIACCSKNFTRWLWMMCSATLQLTNRGQRTGT